MYKECFHTYVEIHYKKYNKLNYDPINQQYASNKLPIVDFSFRWFIQRIRTNTRFQNCVVFQVHHNSLSPLFQWCLEEQQAILDQGKLVGFGLLLVAELAVTYFQVKKWRKNIKKR